MCMRILLVLGVIAISLNAGVPPTLPRDDDSDGDGVADVPDVCDNTPVGVPVDDEGRPLGDIDQDCDTDIDDFAIFVEALQGPAAEGRSGADTPLADLDRDEDMDLQDLALFQEGTTGSLAPLPGACCYGDGSCEMVTRDACGGAWLGGDTDCASYSCDVPEGMILVPAGGFKMGDPLHEGQPHERPVRYVYLSSYYIGQYEVTVEEYVNALSWARVQGGLIAWSDTDGVVYKYGSGTSYAYCDTWPQHPLSRIEKVIGESFAARPGFEQHPMVRVTWYGAVAYCNWRSAMEGRTPCYNLDDWTCSFEANGYRLPTEAEWEKAAGWDPAQQRHFRYSEHTDGGGYFDFDGARGNYSFSGNPFGALEYRTSPVGFYNGELHQYADFNWPGGEDSYQTEDARSYYGCYDMSGNVWELCHDWYSATSYNCGPYRDPLGPVQGVERVIRGGSWTSTQDCLRSAFRSFVSPERRGMGIGLRVALGLAPG